jgi:hypothetical protein
MPSTNQARAFGTLPAVGPRERFSPGVGDLNAITALLLQCKMKAVGKGGDVRFARCLLSSLDSPVLDIVMDADFPCTMQPRWSFVNVH